MSRPTAQNATEIREDLFRGFRRLSLSNGTVRVDVLPELGGKLISILLLRTNHEFLLAPPERDYRRAVYGDRFEEYDTSGYDECVPTVSECDYPEAPFQGVCLPDHGELWSVPWHVEEPEGEGIALRVQGTRIPYGFCRRMRLEGSDVVLEYELENRSGNEIRYLWSAHPLLSVAPGAEIVLPPEVQKVFVNWSRGERLGRFGEECGWPIARLQYGDVDELHRLKPPEAGIADKLFTPALRQGYCGLYDRARGHSITFSFDPAKVPYVGMWICQGGWPESRPAKHYTVALEPCSGRPDALAAAMAREECPRIAPGQTVHWVLRLQLREGPPAPISLTEVDA